MILCMVLQLKANENRKMTVQHHGNLLERFSRKDWSIVELEQVNDVLLESLMMTKEQLADKYNHLVNF